MCTRYAEGELWSACLLLLIFVGCVGERYRVLQAATAFAHAWESTGVQEIQTASSARVANGRYVEKMASESVPYSPRLLPAPVETALCCRIGWSKGITVWGGYYAQGAIIS